MKNKDGQPMTESEKIDYLIKKVDQIERQLNPPFWKKCVHWFFAHFWTLLLLGILGYFMWQIWEIVQGVQQSIQGFENRFGDFKMAIEAQVQKISDQAAALNLDKIKFWE